MNCEQAREIISVVRDNEATRSERSAVADHLEGCEDCIAWLRQVERVDRAFRFEVADIPDMTYYILDTWDENATRRVPITVRAGLVVIALLNIVMALPLVFISRSPHDPVVFHLGTESAAFVLTLAVVFLVTAVDVKTEGRILVVGVAVGVIAVLVARDLITGRVGLVAELVHLPSLVGLLLMVLMRRSTQPTAEPPVEDVGSPGRSRKQAA